MVRPSAFAVSRLMIKSNLLDCSTGRPVGVGTLEDLDHEGRGAALQVKKVCAVDHEATSLRVLVLRERSRIL